MKNPPALDAPTLRARRDAKPCGSESTKTEVGTTQGKMSRDQHPCRCNRADYSKTGNATPPRPGMAGHMPSPRPGKAGDMP